MYAVIDTETTGLSPNRDRIIELAIVGLDADGNREWEWCTLLNPDRDTGHGLAIRVHQIYASDVLAAPRFSECAGHISDLLRGRILIGHNLRFDLGMLLAEFGRLGHRIPDPSGVCTLELAHRHGLYPADLCSCCNEFGIPMDGAHHALADARATAELYRHLMEVGVKVSRLEKSIPLADQLWPAIPPTPFTPITRPVLPARPTRRAAYPPAGRAEADRRISSDPPKIEQLSLDRDDPVRQYLAALETAIADRVISQAQAAALRSLAIELGLSDEQVANIHLLFLRGLAGSMWADGAISAHERYDLGVTARALSLNDTEVDAALKKPTHLELVSDSSILHQGDKVVFTGEMSLSRAEWTKRAEDTGLRVVGSVSKRIKCLVVPYSETGSSKSRKARELGVEVVSEQRFARMLERLRASAALQDPAMTIQGSH